MQAQILLGLFLEYHISLRKNERWEGKGQES